MNKSLLLTAAAAGLLLVSAHPPEMESVVAAPAPAKAAPAPAPAPAPRVAARANDYPPCTATRTDSCTQVRSYRRHRAPDRRRIQLAMRAGERG